MASRPQARIQLIYFAFDQDRFDTQGKTRLRRLLETVAGATEVQWQVVGHTDAVGSRAYNEKLSRARAEAVANWLVAHGQSVQTEVKFRGEDDPAWPNTTEEQRAQNRRVEVQVTFVK